MASVPKRSRTVAASAERVLELLELEDESNDGMSSDEESDLDRQLRNSSGESRVKQEDNQRKEEEQRKKEKLAHLGKKIKYHDGPNYGDVGKLELNTYIDDTSTFDNLRHRDMGWPLWVTWTDRFNQKHKVTFTDETQEVTVRFPAGGKSVNWYHSGGHDITRFDAETTWVEVRFWYVGSDWINNHGIRVHLRGFKSASTGRSDVSWDQVQRGLNAGKTVAGSV